MAGQIVEDLRAQVHTNTNLLSSIKAFIQGLIEKVNAAQDLEEVKAITAELSAGDTDIAQFIADNTPAAPVANETGPAVETPVTPTE